MPTTTAITRENILGLDVSTKTGFATSIASGVWDLSIKRDESSGMRLIRFKSKLQEMIQKHEIKLIAFERSSGQYQSTVIVQSEIHGVLKMVCEENKIEYRAYSASEIKKFATGKGNSGKPLMIEAAKRKYGIEIIDDNHADALHIYNLCITDLGLNEIF
jgi:crossover junction endodeoxyribonuclease RuvC